MNLFETPLSFNEADSHTFINIKPITRMECVNLEDSLKRILVEDISAIKSIPPFSRSTMDGYAVMAKDTIGSSADSPKILDVIDYLYAGGVSREHISDGKCIQITTGAKMPAGADSVVITEHTGIENGKLCIYKPVNYGDNIEVEGEDTKRGRVILKQGTLITPARIGILATQGIQQVKVYDKPKIAVISNGEELIEPGGVLKDGQIYDINSFTISSIIKENGCLPMKFGIVEDNSQKIKSIIEEALKVADMVFISGGSSRGEKDYLTEILQKMGRVPSFKIKASDGKSGTFIMADGKPILGTPGFPFSCLINAYVLLVPILRKLSNLPDNRDIVIKAKLSERVEKDSIFSGRFLAVKIEGHKAIPVCSGKKGITGIAKADGYVLFDEDVQTIEEGTDVSVILF